MRDVQGGAGADQAENVRIVFQVRRHDRSHDLDFILVAGGEQRPNGPIDEPARQNFLGGGPAFALDKAAGELSSGVNLLAVIAGQGEEIPPFNGVAFDHRSQGHGVAVTHDRGTMRLLGEFARFKN